MAFFEPQTHDAYLLLPHASAIKALTLPAPDGPGATLPSVSLNPRRLWQEVDHLVGATRDVWRASVSVRRCVHTRVDAGTRRVSVYELENASPAWEPPPGGRWVESVEQAGLTSAEQRVWLGDWFKRQHTPHPPTRAAWYCGGWIKGLSPFLKTRLLHLGIRPIGEFEQVRCWGRSAIWHIRTNEGRVWLKAVPPMFAHEVSVIDFLASRFPWHAPDVLSADPGREWVLMREFGRTLDAVPDGSVWVDVLGAFARLQVNLSDHADTLRAIGVPDRPVTGLGEAFTAVIDDIRRAPGRLSTAEVKRLREEAVPRVIDAAATLAGGGVPASLEHGDFWAGQTIVDTLSPGSRAYRFRFTDWSDASVTHPFFSFLYFADAEEWAGLLDDAVEWLPRFHEAYLEPWRRFAPGRELAGLVAAARIAGPAHFAVTYARHIVPNMEQPWEMRPTVDACLRRVLKACEAGVFGRPGSS